MKKCIPYTILWVLGIVLFTYLIASCAMNYIVWLCDPVYTEGFYRFVEFSPIACVIVYTPIFYCISYPLLLVELRKNKYL